MRAVFEVHRSIVNAVAVPYGHYVYHPEDYVGRKDLSRVVALGLAGTDLTAEYVALF